MILIIRVTNILEVERYQLVYFVITDISKLNIILGFL